eukprot:197352-Prymnesium_polylepis.1
MNLKRRNMNRDLALLLFTSVVTLYALSPLSVLILTTTVALGSASTARCLFSLLVLPTSLPHGARRHMPMGSVARRHCRVYTAAPLACPYQPTSCVAPGWERRASARAPRRASPSRSRCSP